jgi:hypothetical protein
MNIILSETIGPIAKAPLLVRFISSIFSAVICLFFVKQARLFILLLEHRINSDTLFLYLELFCFPFVYKKGWVLDKQ